MLETSSKDARDGWKLDHFIYGVHMNGDVNAHVKGQIKNYPKATNNFCVRFIYVNYTSQAQVA